MSDEVEAIIPDITFVIQGRTREAAVALADQFANLMLTKIGGEPWIMVDDDFKKLWPNEPLTLTDDQGAMYVGTRRYVFKGPMIGSQTTREHDGYRTQQGEPLT